MEANQNLPLSPKQLKFIRESTRQYNLAHGSVRSGKTIGTLFRFLQEVITSPYPDGVMIGHTSKTVYDNAIKFIWENPALEFFKDICTWSRGTRVLYVGPKKIQACGAKDEGAIRTIQGQTFSVCYCDEMTLYPTSIIQMIRTRMSQEKSILFASMNPTSPYHILKEWIDKSRNGTDLKTYELHFRMQDNPFLSQEFIDDIKNSLTGVFYKRHYEGDWCLAEGAIFDFFDPQYHVIDAPEYCADYWILGVDYGTDNAFAAVLIGVYTGIANQTHKKLWVEKEFFWDHRKQGRQMVNSEFADAVERLVEGYYIKCCYMDPSAASFKLELQRRGIHVALKTNNEVLDGISATTTAVKDGTLKVCASCKNLIREMTAYCWKENKNNLGKDEPIKKDDHAIDALRYAIATHKVSTFNEEAYYREQDLRNKQRGNTVSYFTQGF